MTPEGRDLLDEAIETLRGHLAARLSGEARYLALLAANAVATARREAAVGAMLEMNDAAAARARAIRNGAHDDDPSIYDALLKAAAVRAWVADPSALTDAERAKYIGKGAS